MNSKINYIEGNIDYSTNEPLFKVAILSLMTLNLYLFFWFFINLRRIKFIKKEGLSPWLVLVMGIPIVNIIVPIYLFYNILDLNKQDKLKNIEALTQEQMKQFRHAKEEYQNQSTLKNTAKEQLPPIQPSSIEGGFK